jgi:hypothetical protein
LITALALHIHAAFTGNDWVYLLSSGALVTCLIGFIWPFLQLLQVQATASLTEEEVGLGKCQIQIELSKKTQTTFTLALLPLSLMWLAFGLLRLRGGHHSGKKVLQLGPVAIENTSPHLTLRFPAQSFSRGVYEFEDIQLSSGFPFGLIWWTRIISMKTDSQGNKLRLTIYAKDVPVSGNFLFHLQGVNPSIGLSASNSLLLNRSSLVREIREYRIGDSPRHVHWPSSARLGKLMVREFDSEILPGFDLYLDLHSHWRSEEQFELAVLTAQSLAQLGHRLGCMPELILNPPLDSSLLADLMSDIPPLPPGIDLVCEILARVEPLPTSDARAGKSSLYLLLEQHLAKQPLLSIQPGNQSIMKSSPGRGNYVDYSVELLQITGLKEDIGWSQTSDRRALFDALLQTDTEGEQARSPWSMQTNPIATIYGEDDLSRL